MLFKSFTFDFGVGGLWHVVLPARVGGEESLLVFGHDGGSGSVLVSLTEGKDGLGLRLRYMRKLAQKSGIALASFATASTSALTSPTTSSTPPASLAIRSLLHVAVWSCFLANLADPFYTFAFLEKIGIPNDSLHCPLYNKTV